MPPTLLDFPGKIQIQTINRCNYACAMCPYPESTALQEKTELDEGLFYRVLDEVEASGKRIKLCLMLQNEPLLDRRFLSFLDRAHGAEEAIVSISAVTNGSALNEELLDALVAYERFHLTVSVNATEGRRYARVHGRDFWDRIHTLLSEWRGCRRRVRLSFVVDGDSVEEARKFQRYWSGLRYSTRFVPVNTRAHALSVDAAVHVPDDDYGYCHYPVDTLNVLCDGSVILCCNDWKHSLKFGNLHTCTIAEIWNAAPLRRLRQLALEGRLRENPMCANCDYPMSSARRVRFEAELVENPSAWATDAFPFAFHETAIYPHPEGDPIPLFVWQMQKDGQIMGFAPHVGYSLPRDIYFELRIGYSGILSMGSLDPIRCPGELTAADWNVDWGSAFEGVRIALDTDAEEFRFFPWYCADWRRSAR